MTTLAGLEDPLNSWIPLTPLEEMARTDYDVIIVGSGAGGGAILWRLCERWRNNGMRIGLIEAGDLLLPTHMNNLAILSGGRAERFMANPEITRRIGKTLPEFSGAKQVLALGGRTIQWGNVTPRMPLHILEQYPVPPNEMQFYYGIAEQAMNVMKSFIPNSSLQHVILSRLRINGYPEAAAPPIAVDIKPTQFGVVHSNAYFSSIAFLAEALNRMPFDLAVNARAVQVLTEQGKAAGVRVMSLDKKTYIVHAKTVVISASTLETPRILLNSGISSSAIGRFLIDHSAIRGTAIVSRKGFPEILEPISIIIQETKDRPYQLQIFGRERPSHEEMGIIIQGYGLVEPRAENRITLDPYRIDEYGVPAVQVHYTYSQKDLNVIRKMTAGMRKAFSAIGATLVSMDGQPELCLRPPGDDNHESGSCRIGDDPATSAADRYGQIHGVSGLYVADNSVLPFLGTNPTLTTVALAIRTADRIIHRASY
ncbi:GMC family oxidoreductase [Paenibacillus alkaliterrae]|uniref:GMC oxidoreductase n=1 Tax=Paenibacillus alkaliterrae TaxID=320909 RepID=UPI001F439EFA|nr:GMC family oxidoreductase [Paenibacillus alkaliterrae]MCF2938059.1 GMC family oxidoreductase [Paenibacillus alkaliterrae]